MQDVICGSEEHSLDLHQSVQYKKKTSINVLTRTTTNISTDTVLDRYQLDKEDRANVL
jgi:hypothetical protein